jgi:pyruvate kinase
MAPVAILADLQGPKFRISELPGGMLEVRLGQVLSIGPGPEDLIRVEQPEILSAMSKGGTVLLGDGDVELKLMEQTGLSFAAKAVSGGSVKSRQGITLVGKHFDVDPITAKDEEDIEQAMGAGADYIALSYVKSGDDMRRLRELVSDRSIRLCSKIETKEAFLRLDDIVESSDLVMVARGDMGLQMHIEDVPIAQKRIIAKCTEKGKPVITATQMLESMMVNARPTRAEATDVANAILDGTDAVMLSGETASGQHPIECVEMMVRISEKAEALYDRSTIEKVFREQAKDGISHTEAVAHSVVDLASIIKPAAIITNTTSGQTARLVSKFRPRAQILCATYDARTQAQMAVIWGVEAVHLQKPVNTDEGVNHAIDAFKMIKRLRSGDLVIITAGVPAGQPGNTNLILTRKVD